MIRLPPRSTQGRSSAASDEYKRQALTGIETVMLPTAARWAHLSSSMIREVARLGGDVSQFVTDDVARRIRAVVALSLIHISEPTRPY